MKKIRQSLFAFMLLMLPTGVVAQDVLIGVKGGINSSTVDFSDESLDISSGGGIVAGIFVEFGISDLFAIRPEGLYSSKGFEASDGGAELELSVDYIEIPLLLVARLGDSSVRPVLFAGPVFGFESSCELSGGDDTTEIETDCSAVPDDPIETESSDFGAAFGAGLEIDLGGLTLLGDARYTLGLRDVDPGSGSSAKNRAWSFMVGAGIGIG